LNHKIKLGYEIKTGKPEPIPRIIAYRSVESKSKGNVK